MLSPNRPPQGLQVHQKPNHEQEETKALSPKVFKTVVICPGDLCHVKIKVALLSARVQADSWPQFASNLLSGTLDVPQNHLAIDGHLIPLTISYRITPDYYTLPLFSQNHSIKILYSGSHESEFTR